MYLNPTQLKDLEFICDVAARSFAQTEETTWQLRAEIYRRTFLIEIEKQKLDELHHERTEPGAVNGRTPDGGHS
jgi:hypothetical protein